MKTDEEKGTYVTELRKRNPPQTIEALLLSMNLDDPLKQEDLETIKTKQREQAAIDGIPEHLWRYARAYNNLTGQFPSNATRGDWIAEMEIWYQEQFDEKNLKDAFEYINVKSGFPVGRPGTLTNIARGMKTKATVQTAPSLNTKAIEATKKAIEEKWSDTFVPRPAHIERPKGLLPSKPKKPLFKKGQEPK